MKRHKYKPFTLCAFLALSVCASGAQKVATVGYEVVPLPRSIEKHEKAKPFVFTSKTKIACEKGNARQERTARFLAEYLLQMTGREPALTGDLNARNAIVLKTGYQSETPEAYRLSVGKDRIIIEGAGEAGVFYGVQTLRKSIPVDGAKNKILFPAVEITDAPRFAYRGMHLDVARHTFPVGFIKKYIDLLALHNINRFHWHLTDDQGWRIEIKKYPELTRIGSFRDCTVIGKNTKNYDETRYGGFFTQDEIREVVAYARERFIEIIPEIDLPGHMLGALAAYPGLGCTGGPYKVSPRWGVFEDVLCAGNDEVYTFLENVLEEVTALFPYEYIHIGGDECPKTRWKACLKCQAKIKELGIEADDKHSAENQLQSYVMQRVGNFLESRGKRIIGWDEILEGGVVNDAIVMSWRGMKGGIEAARQHHDVIMTPNSYAYFDYYQTKDTQDEPLGIGGFVPVEKVYSFEPVPDELAADEKKYIIGVQANLWTEYVLTTAHAEYMVLPRMGALAEVQWTAPELKNYDAFLPRLTAMTKLYDLLGYNYAKHIFKK